MYAYLFADQEGRDAGVSAAFYPLAAFLSSRSLTRRCHSPSASCSRRRMRAVTGSSADAAAFAGPLRRGLDGVGGFQRLDPLGQFGNGRRRVGAWLRGRAGQAGLELVAQAGQLGQVGVVGEGRAEAGLVVAELGLRDRQVLPDAGAFRAVAAGQALQGVQDGPRPVVVAREHGLARDRPFEVQLGRRIAGASTRPKRRPR